MSNARRKKDDGPKRSRPALTEEGRENQLVSKAVTLAERQLDDGSASAQVITHYLKLGSSREKLEQERLRNENELTQAKIQTLAAAERMELLYEKAIVALGTYKGEEIEDTYDGED